MLPLFTTLNRLDIESGQIQIDRAQILTSIQNEISRLVDTRLPRSLKKSSRVHILDYGLPDDIFTDLADEIAVAKAENHIHRTLQHFEPRLQDTLVRIIKNGVSKVLVEVEFKFEFDGHSEIAKFTVEPS